LELATSALEATLAFRGGAAVGSGVGACVDDGPVFPIRGVCTRETDWPFATEAGGAVAETIGEFTPSMDRIKASAIVLTGAVTADKSNLSFAAAARFVEDALGNGVVSNDPRNILITLTNALLAIKAAPLGTGNTNAARIPAWFDSVALDAFTARTNAGGFPNQIGAISRS
jgi:hypothetical protein